MALKKYELTGETLVHNGTTLHRIRALRKIQKAGRDVDVGDEGGWIESTRNLSQTGSCWIDDSAKAYGNARVIDHALMNGNAEIYDYAELSDYARLRGNAKAYGSATIRDRSSAVGDSEIFECAKLRDRARVRAQAKVHGDAYLENDVTVDGRSVVCGNAHLRGTANIEDGHVASDDDWIAFYNVGSEGGTLTVFATLETVSVGKRTKKVWRCTRGCFDGTTDQFLAESAKTHKSKPKVRSEYKKLIEVAISRLNRHTYMDEL